MAQAFHSAALEKPPSTAGARPWPAAHMQYCSAVTNA